MDTRRIRPAWDVGHTQRLGRSAPAGTCEAKASPSHPVLGRGFGWECANKPAISRASPPSTARSSLKAHVFLWNRRERNPNLFLAAGLCVASLLARKSPTQCLHPKPRSSAVSVWFPAPVRSHDLGPHTPQRQSLAAAAAAAAAGPLLFAARHSLRQSAVPTARCDLSMPWSASWPKATFHPITSWTSSASSTTLTKKDGGRRRSSSTSHTAKALLATVCEDLTRYLRPSQLGFGTKNSCEAIVHTLRRWFRKDDNDDKRCLLNEWHQTWPGTVTYATRTTVLSCLAQKRSRTKEECRPIALCTRPRRSHLGRTHTR